MRVFFPGVHIIIVNSAARRTRKVMDVARDYKRMTSAGWAWLVTDGTTSLVGHFYFHGR